MKSWFGSKSISNPRIEKKFRFKIDHFYVTKIEIGNTSSDIYSVPNFLKPKNSLWSHLWCMYTIYIPYCFGFEYMRMRGGGIWLRPPSDSLKSHWKTCICDIFSIQFKRKHKNRELNWKWIIWLLLFLQWMTFVSPTFIKTQLHIFLVS